MSAKRPFSLFTTSSSFADNIPISFSNHPNFFITLAISLKYLGRDEISFSVFERNHFVYKISSMLFLITEVTLFFPHRYMLHS
ncbi:TPA: hypothetical protein DCZ39_01145 [Patescibacteria group bacterium]|nr:hypothetical protein [Candidatus Gracilibacteria bacterium]